MTRSSRGIVLELERDGGNSSGLWEGELRSGGPMALGSAIRLVPQLRYVLVKHIDEKSEAGSCAFLVLQEKMYQTHCLWDSRSDSALLRLRRCLSLYLKAPHLRTYTHNSAKSSCCTIHICKNSQYLGLTWIHKTLCNCWQCSFGRQQPRRGFLVKLWWPCLHWALFMVSMRLGRYFVAISAVWVSVGV